MPLFTAHFHSLHIFHSSNPSSFTLQSYTQKKMENEENQTISNATTPETSPNRSDNHRRDSKPSSPLAKDSPARSSISSYQSHPSSLSHGFSPEEDHRVQASPPENLPAKPPSPRTVVNRSVQEEPMTVTKTNPGLRSGFTGGVVEDGGGRRLRTPLSILRRTKREAMVKRIALGFRVWGMVFCLVSFSVMTADRNQGWALDSFDRYKEFRYCMSVNVIGFVYSLVQAYDMAYHLATGKNVCRNPFRYYFDFSADQMLTYLLISASSSAATRVDDWQSNWGSDKFPTMASASVGLSFLSFAALASSTLISGYALCTSKGT